MTYTLSGIQHILTANWLQSIDPEAKIEQLLTDTRQVATPAYALFFALRGKRHDAHKHLEQAYTQGVRNFVVSRKISLKSLPEANVLLVSDSLMALQQLAAWHRSQFPDLKVIGITGSNGKTIVKEWLWQLLSPDFKVVRSPKSYNSQVGVPLSLWQIQPHHQVAIIEAGISQPGEMQRLAAMIKPNYGIFTNLGSAHQEGFNSDAEKAQEKLQLYDDASCLISKLEPNAAANVQGEEQAVSWGHLLTKPGRNTLLWTLNADNQPANAENIRLVTCKVLPGNKTEISIHAMPGQARDLSGQYVLPFSDPASIENSIHCWFCALALGCDPRNITDRMTWLEPVEMRLEIKAGIQNSVVINDAYNNDINALRIALQFARQQARQGKLTLVLSDIFQSGQEPETLWAEVSAILQEYMTAQDRLIGIGKAVRLLGEGKGMHFLHTPPIFYPTTADMIAQAGKLDWSDQVVLLKGARSFEFERIATRLEQKAHKTVLEVNLTAMVHNLNAYNRLLSPGVMMMAMVKAAGYGSGSAEVAKLLEFHKVDYLGVAYTDEGIELRKAGVQLPILVLNPELSALDAMYRYRLEPEIYSLDLLDALCRYTGTEKRMDIHLKLDTGMHRLGFEAQDIVTLCAMLESHRNLEVKTVFSHLSASDNPTHDAFTHLQAAKFNELYARIAEKLGYSPIRHICNTGGIARFPAYHFEMVRLGIGLYGIDGSGLQDQLRVVNTLKATISQVKVIASGESVGYNRNSGILHETRRIATISIGYADGFLRLAGGGRYAVSIRGQLAPTIGNVCMDMTMVDVSHIPEAKAGDEVIVFGVDPPVQSLAQCLQTIPYEIFTNISERVKRVYWTE